MRVCLQSWGLVAAALLLALSLEGAQASEANSKKRSSEGAEEEKPAAEPYSFSYTASAGAGQSSHSESGDGTGRVTGFYTIVGEDGRERRVDYVADENGFRASVRTNEIGTRSQSSADAEFRAEEPSAKQLEAAKISAEDHRYFEQVHEISRNRKSVEVASSPVVGWKSPEGQTGARAASGAVERRPVGEQREASALATEESASASSPQQPMARQKARAEPASTIQKQMERQYLQQLVEQDYPRNPPSASFSGQDGPVRDALNTGVLLNNQSEVSQFSQEQSDIMSQFSGAREEAEVGEGSGREVAKEEPVEITTTRAPARFLSIDLSEPAAISQGEARPEKRPEVREPEQEQQSSTTTTSSTSTSSTSTTARPEPETNQQSQATDGEEAKRERMSQLIRQTIEKMRRTKQQSKEEARRTGGQKETEPETVSLTESSTVAAEPSAGSTASSVPKFLQTTTISSTSIAGAQEPSSTFRPAARKPLEQQFFQRNRAPQHVAGVKNSAKTKLEAPKDVEVERVTIASSSTSTSTSSTTSAPTEEELRPAPSQKPETERSRLVVSTSRVTTVMNAQEMRRADEQKQPPKTVKGKRAQKGGKKFWNARGGQQETTVKPSEVSSVRSARQSLPKTIGAAADYASSLGFGSRKVTSKRANIQK